MNFTDATALAARQGRFTTKKGKTYQARCIHLHGGESLLFGDLIKDGVVTNYSSNHKLADCTAV